MTKGQATVVLTITGRAATKAHVKSLLSHSEWSLVLRGFVLNKDAYDVVFVVELRLQGQ